MWRRSRKMRSTFPFLEFALISKVCLSALELYLTLRQRRRHAPDTVPSARVKALVSDEKYEQAQRYCFARTTFRVYTNIINCVLSVALIFVYPRLWVFAGRVVPSGSIMPPSELYQTFAFFAGVACLDLITGLPAGAYETFWLEAKFGFNRTTVRTFIVDIVKSLLLSVTLGTPFLIALYFVLDISADWNPMALAAGLWLFLSTITVSMMVLFPSVIAPIFNKYDPLPDGPLKEKLNALAKQLSFPLDKLYVIDGSLRSSHSNAFFAGLFKKMIVIYDSLLEQTKGHDEQVVAVLAHEMGHWALSHTVLGVGISLTQTALICVLFGLTAHNPDLFASFGYSGMPRVIGLILFSELLTPLEAVLTPLSHFLSRKLEFQADQYAKKLGMAQDLGNALVTMHISNLSNMSPDWLYSTWNFSHPTLVERLDALDVQVVPPAISESKKDE